MTQRLLLPSHLSVLRKENLKYNIIPYNLNVPRHFKLMGVDHIFALLVPILILDLNLKSNLRKKKRYFKINPP